MSKATKTEFVLRDLGMELIVKVKPIITIDLADAKGNRIGIIINRAEAQAIAQVLQNSSEKLS